MYQLRREKVERPIISIEERLHTQTIPAEQQPDPRTTHNEQKDGEGKITEHMRKEYETNYPRLRADDPIKRILSIVIEN